MTTVQEGDMVQWTINGVDQFADPRKVTLVTECGEYCFVEGSATGLPTNQITVTSACVDGCAGGRAAGASVPERFTLFWHGPFSQWHACRFSVNGVLYNCAEQYMMAAKARMFQDFSALEKIMRASDPSVQKRTGRTVKSFYADKWNADAKDIVYQGNRAKFTQNPTLLHLLLSTHGTTLVEASPYDKIWGIGLPASDPRALSRETWQGTNWLGEVLTQLREDLMRRS